MPSRFNWCTVTTAPASNDRSPVAEPVPRHHKLPDDAAVPGALPNCIVIGAMKCGTTSLNFYLHQHPDIFMARPKELNFFLKERNWYRGVDWYRSHFSKRMPIRGETSPLYAALPVYEGVPERMHAVVPEASLIYLVRDPVERLRSHYCHARLHIGERRTFEDALEQNPLMFGVSSYHAQLTHYLRHFPRERILIVPSEDLKSNRLGTLRRIFTFLGVDPTFTSPRFRIVSHRTKFKRESRYHKHLYLYRARQFLKRTLPFELSGPMYWLLTLPITRPLRKPELSTVSLNIIRSRLQQEVDAFRLLTGMDFRDWTI